jgi:hypothetical protein
MIAILAVLVDLGEIARIEPGPGAIASPRSSSSPCSPQGASSPGRSGTFRPMKRAGGWKREEGARWPARPKPPPEPRTARNVPADPVLRKSRGFSLVWLIPLVAVGIGLWLAWTTIMHRGRSSPSPSRPPTGWRPAARGSSIARSMSPGRGGAGPSTFRHRGPARLEPSFAPHMTRARGSGWSGRGWPLRGHRLGTLLSGAYIEVDPAAGESARASPGSRSRP